jgi:7-cyano-7-deazaguanine synthase in queuosine biosynthesis
MNDDELPTVKVNVLEPGGRALPGWISCGIGTNLIFNSHTLASYFLAKWEPKMFDLLLLAAAVDFCDKIQRRPALGWGRNFELRLPVHEPDLWDQKSVYESLHDALEFLTGDRWKLTFVKRRKPAIGPQQELFILPTKAEAVIPFSDGLDSHAVGALMAQKYGTRLVCVRLGPKKKDHPKDASGRKQPFKAVPYEVKSGESRFVESSARSRGFKFAILSGAAAYFSRAGKVIVPESGQGALGPTLVPVGQAYEDYRNHPLFTTRMTALFKALLGYDVVFDFPRLWFTKGETLNAYMALSDGKNPEWTKTRSCWQDNRFASVNNKRRQCGICAACMLRRLSIHSANLKEDNETYIWENLSASSFNEGAAEGFTKITKSQKEYAIAGTLHLDHLANLKQSRLSEQPLKLASFQLARSLGESEATVQPKLERMLSQHEKEWKSYMNSLGSDSFVVQWTGQQ